MKKQCIILLSLIALQNVGHTNDQLLGNDFLLPETEHKTIQGQVITVDTRDREKCYEVAKRLFSVSDLCLQDEEKPYVSVIKYNPIESQERYRTKIDFSGFSDKNKAALKDTRNLGLMSVGMMGLILALPEDVSNWDKDEMKLDALGQKWKENVKAGPIVDKDDWAINYIGHPYSGAAYYTMARHRGLSKLESFGYSVLVSTFVWEYGIESLAEIPSLQDLISTPIIGSLIGEQFYQWDKKIRANNSELLGSKALASTALFLMNPAGEMSDGINSLLESQDFIEDANTYFVIGKSPLRGSGSRLKDDDYIGIDLEFKF
jgi:hypothetical protein